MDSNLESEIVPASIEEMKGVLSEMEMLPENANYEKIKETLLEIGKPILEDAKGCSIDCPNAGEFIEGKPVLYKTILQHLENLSPLGIKKIKYYHLGLHPKKFK